MEHPDDIAEVKKQLAALYEKNKEMLNSSDAGAVLVLVGVI